MSPGVREAGLTVRELGARGNPACFFTIGLRHPPFTVTCNRSLLSFCFFVFFCGTGVIEQ